jgi:hypothetical protein
VSDLAEIGRASIGHEFGLTPERPVPSRTEQINASIRIAAGTVRERIGFAVGRAEEVRALLAPV